MPKYNHKTIEKKWKKAWEKSGIYKTKETSDKPKYFVLDMFPYPSGAGLHVGHPKGYIATDIVARMKMMQGFNVLHPMGWDAFGLPAENYAIANKVHPSEATEKNIKTFKKQLGLLGFTYDWDREVNTTDPKYYKWTQWAFLQMYKKGLAFESNEPINWCPTCQTGLANEDLEDGKCERCGTVVEQKPMRQWVLKITKYADRLLNDLDKLKEWPEPIKEMQRNWIGRSEGATIKFPISNFQFSNNDQKYIEVFTTRPDTIFGATYLVIAPEHPLVRNLKSEIRNFEEVEKYIESAKNKSNLERTELQKEKTGVELKGIKAVNPATNEELPIFVADYVITGYGTGAIMAVPAHDERDWEFAKKYNLPIKEVLKGGQVEEGAFTGDGLHVNSDFLDGLNKSEAISKIISWLEEKGIGTKKVQYKLRDWVFSRQRYWGEPIPLIHCENCKNKKPKVLLIHGLNGNSTENWFLWFKEEMEKKGYEVLIPNLGGEGHPTLDQWLGVLDKLDIKNDDRLFVVAHSLGAPTACQFILKNKLKVKKLILVAPTGAHQGEINWKNLLAASCGEAGVNSIKKFNEANQNLNRLNNLVSETAVYLSDNDPFIPQTVEEDYKILNPVVRHFHSKGHFNRKAGLFQFPEILPDLPDNNGWVPVPVNELPIELPKVKDYAPSGTGESPLATIHDWVNVKCPECGGKAKRETNTMPQWAGSCWYYLRYIDPNNNKELVSKEKEKYWSPVDLYVGGAEHATRHLIYARFWHKFLFDIDVVNYDEPFTKLQNVGLILAEDGRKMSKRWNNVINPDDIVEEYGADAMRVYEMFMGPFDQPCAWSTSGLIGTHRFIERVYNLVEKVDVTPSQNFQFPISNFQSNSNDKISKSKIETLLHQTIKKVSDDIPAMKYNTAIAQMMILVNEMGKEQNLLLTHYSLFLQLLAPFAPHIAEELWSQLGHTESIFLSTWPKYDAELAKDTEITLAVQVNGKLRDTLKVSADISEEEAKKQAINSVGVQKWLEDKTPKKVIYVKGKLVSIVV